jgi:hypothetical protein
MRVPKGCVGLGAGGRSQRGARRAPAESLRISAYRGQASLCPCHPPRVCRGAKPLDGVTNLQIRNPKRALGFLPAEGLGVSPRLNSLESLFDKEGLRELGARGLKRGFWDSLQGHDPKRIDTTGADHFFIREQALERRLSPLRPRYSVQIMQTRTVFLALPTRCRLIR